MSSEPTSTPTPAPAARASDEPGTTRLQRAGRVCWAALGVVGVIVLAGYVASVLSLVVVPVVLALFPATVLVPLAGWLRAHGTPAAVAAVAAIVAAVAGIAVIVGAMVPLVAAEAPGLADSAADGVAEIEGWLRNEPLGVDVGGLSELMSAAQEQLGRLGDVAPQALGAATAAFQSVIGLVLLLVVLFFYLKDGRRLAEGLVGLLPERLRPRATEIAERGWATLGSYFRGQLLVALVNAVLIGVGLLLLGVPLAVPLAVLVLFGGLFPVVGAVVTGGLAALVALADGGLTSGLLVVALVVAVQQLEGNVWSPYILGRAVALHPLVVLLAITAGGVLLGVLGAFLAVPVAAVVAEAVRTLRQRPRGSDVPAPPKPAAAR